MKNSRMILFLLVAFLAVGCSKKEDAPPPSYPHVSGSWAGNGTDDAIGYYTLGVDMTQSGDQAAGHFTMTGGVATIKGDFNVIFGPEGKGNVKTLTMTRQTWTINDPANANRVCAGTLTLVPYTSTINGSFVSFGYTMSDCVSGTWNGGANLSKITRGN